MLDSVLRNTGMRQFRRALCASAAQPLAYQMEGRGAELATLFERIIRRQRVSDAEISDAFAEDEDRPRPERVTIAAGPTVIPAGKGGKATALLSVRGVALYDVEFQPYAFSTLLLGQTVTALANDQSIGTIVLDIDSPGGVVTGTPEAADAIFAARESKTVVALVNPLAASAAYYLASQATEIIAVPSAEVGSIGVFMLHMDCGQMMEDMGVKPTFIYAGKYKTEGNPYEPLGEEAKAYFQSEVDLLYRDFLKAVARGRGMPVAEIEENFGQGRTVMTAAAKKAGMIDRIASVDAMLARLGINAVRVQGSRRAEEAAETAPATEPARESQAETHAPVMDDVATPEADVERRSRRRRLALLRA